MEAVSVAGRREETEASFASADELREVLDRLLAELDDDDELGPRLRATHVPHRYEFPDLGVVLNVTEVISSAKPGCLRWRFSDEIDWQPELELKMDSPVANSYLQGRENLAIAIARRRIRCRGNALAALTLVPANRLLMDRYRALVRREYRHLLLA